MTSLEIEVLEGKYTDQMLRMTIDHAETISKLIKDPKSDFNDLQIVLPNTLALMKVMSEFIFIDTKSMFLSVYSCFKF